MISVTDAKGPFASETPVPQVAPEQPPIGLESPSEAALLFEVSWEVCAQAGGIYTVLRSKAPATVRRWADAYFLVGPYREASARVELEEQPPPEVVRGAIADLEQSGVGAHFGRWLVTGRPYALLLDSSALKQRLGEIKYSLWKDVNISSPDGDFEYDDTLCFGVALVDFLAGVVRHAGRRPVLAHFHEWQAAAALPLLRRRAVPLATVFTTHATLVGRALASANADLYGSLANINAGAVARAHGFEHRHALEGSAAQSADVFTTVSSITAQEAEHFLGRRADVLLPNGLNVERFAAPHEFQVLHRQNKEVIHQFVMGHFFPSYHFDLDNTLYMFSSGRYEYRNKGLDVFIDALGELNRRMQAENSPVTVVAFIITRAAYRALNVETLNRQAMFHELRDTCQDIEQTMGRRLFRKVATGRLPGIGDLLDEYALVHLKRMMYAMQRQTLPTIVTHDLVDDTHDPVLQHLRSARLWNRPEDRVKVIFHPEFMSSTSPLLAMDYDQFVRGCHLGVFPSYYEPWGYTPLECVVRGIPAITSDLSGFGQYVMENFPDHDAEGIFVARRRDVSFAATVAQVAGWMHSLTCMSRRERIALRNRVESHAEDFDWSRLEQHYASARRLALQLHYPGPDRVPEAQKQT
jgi:glycogen(starch) synthase